MAFIIFNGTVVYESGPIRWAGLLLFVETWGGRRLPLLPPAGDGQAVLLAFQ